MAKNHLQLGAYGEKIATQYLIERGYVLVAHNYKKPWGEIDIIVQKNDKIFFVEVKTQKTKHAAFRPEERVDREKIRKIWRTATLFIQKELRAKAVKWQIDIIAITFHMDQHRAHIAHFKNIASDYS